MILSITKIALLPLVAERIVPDRSAARRMIGVLYGSEPFQYCIEPGKNAAQPVLWVQSLAQPNDSIYLGSRETRLFDYSPVIGETYRFRLTAIPTIPYFRKDGSKNRAPIKDHTGWMEWFMLKARRYGFEPFPGVRITNDDVVCIKSPGPGPTQHQLIRFDGRLSVINPQDFLTGLTEGIGHSKHLGAGLFMCMPEKLSH